MLLTTKETELFKGGMLFALLKPELLLSFALYPFRSVVLLYILIRNATTDALHF